MFSDISTANMRYSMVSELGDQGMGVACNSLCVSYIAMYACRQKGVRGVCQPVAAQQFTGHLQNWLCIPVCATILAIAILGKMRNFV